MPDGKAAGYRIVERLAAAAPDERASVIAALRDCAPRISPKYFYDELGCAIYAAICRLPEYYPTRTEAAIFSRHRDELAHAMGRAGQLVDLGAGDCAKAQAWLPTLAPRRYVAVDIAHAEIERALARLSPDYAEIEMVGVVADFISGLPLDGILDEGPVTFFYPGSSIGNFSPGEAREFLLRIAGYCEHPASGLLIGVDAKKNPAVLEAAYDDALGITAAFNRNVLLHLNRRFGFDFALEGFRHVALYDADKGRIEMHLESIREQQVRIDTPRAFAAGERIHTENSYKYHAHEFEALLRESGFTKLRRWSDEAQRFFVFHASR